jgi:hypothetical protein
MVLQITHTYKKYVISTEYLGIRYSEVHQTTYFI